MATSAIGQLKAKLPETEWQAVLSVRALLPDWLAKSVSQAENDV